MLTHIHIKNFAIITELELEVAAGFIVLTGETGAGKSIIIDAVEVALGNRADNHLIRPGCDRAEITLSFDLRKIPAAQQWLTEQDLANENQDCIIRRIINSDGRSRAQINGMTCPLQQVRELSTLLINIHGQHEHQSLMKKEKQRELLDNFAGHDDLLHQVNESFRSWRQIKQQLDELITSKTDTGRIDLLQYQLQELSELALQDNELQQLETTHKKLINAEQVIANSQAIIHLLADAEQNAILSHLNQILTYLQPIKNLDEKFQNSFNLIEQSLILAREAEGEIRHYLDHFELDQAALHQVEQRLSQIHQIARKYHIPAAEINLLVEKLNHSLQALQSIDQRILSLQHTLQQLETFYYQQSQLLTASRKQAANKLILAVTPAIQKLGMPQGQIDIEFEPLKDISAQGMERLEFKVSANPGHPLQPLNKIASGGELSRISLAIQVITAQKENMPTLIFDEVDVGIGGNTAAIVGQLLRQLGKNTQILCITHQPQVAAQGQHHLQVKKIMQNNQVSATLTPLTQRLRIEEIARMLGGLKITQQTLAHAKELMEEIL